MQAETKKITSENINTLVNFIPFTNTFHDIDFLMHHSVWKNMNLVANIIGNIFLFLPLPFFLLRIFNIHNRRHMLLFAGALSIWVETMQYMFLLGVTDIDDVILNVLGAYLGIILLNRLNRKQNTFN